MPISVHRSCPSRWAAPACPSSATGQQAPLGWHRAIRGRAAWMPAISWPRWCSPRGTRSRALAACPSGSRCAQACCQDCCAAWAPGRQAWVLPWPPGHAARAGLPAPGGLLHRGRGTAGTDAACLLIVQCPLRWPAGQCGRRLSGRGPSDERGMPAGRRRGRRNVRSCWPAPGC